VLSNSVHFVLSPSLLVYIAYPDQAVRDVRTWKKMTVHGAVFVLPFILSILFAGISNFDVFFYLTIFEQSELEKKF
jgi:hypothetical protein